MAFTYADSEKDPCHARGIEIARDAIKQQRTLIDAIDGLIRTVRAGNTDAQALLSELSIAQNAVHILDDIIREDTDPLLYPEYCPPKARTLAQQVFNVPELLELILSCLEPGDLLGVQFINRQFRDLVDGSTKLQRSLSLAPHSSPYFYAPFAAFDHPGLVCTFDVRLVDDDGDLKSDRKAPACQRGIVSFKARFDSDLPRIGTKCRRMLLTQPAITQMTASPRCCKQYLDEPSQELVENAEGITIGDLLDVSARLKVEHRHCPRAAIKYHNFETGEVRVVTIFHASIPLLDHDPALLEKRILEAEKRGRRDKRWADEDMIEAFVAARTLAHLSDKPSPVFAEWRKTYSPGSDDSKEEVVAG